MPIPKHSHLHLPVLKLLSKEKEEIYIRDITARLADELGLTEEEMSERIPSGYPRFHNRVEWAITWLRAAGLLESTRRAYVQITDAGRDLLKSNPPEFIERKFLSERFPSFREFLARRKSPAKRDAEVKQDTSAELIDISDIDIDQTPDEVIGEARKKIGEEHKKIERILVSNLLDKVIDLNPTPFEKLIVKVLMAMGYGGATGMGHHLGKSGDDGVDGVIDQDVLGLDRIYVQAKRYKSDSPIGPSVIREFAGSLDMHKAAKGLFVTTSSFTKSAVTTKEKLGKHIILIDGQELAQLMIRYNVGCRVEYSYKLKKLDEEFFEDIQLDI